MSKEQLRRLDNINYFAKVFYPSVQFTDCARFAILNEAEREEFLVFMEKKINKIRKEKLSILNN